MQIFLPPKEAQGKVIDKVIEGLRPITLRFRANARKLILGSIGTPLDHLSVKFLSFFYCFKVSCSFYKNNYFDLRLEVNLEHVELCVLTSISQIINNLILPKCQSRSCCIHMTKCSPPLYFKNKGDGATFTFKVMDQKSIIIRS